MAGRAKATWPTLIHRPARSTQGVVGAAAGPRRRRCERGWARTWLLRSGDAEILVDFPGRRGQDPPPPACSSGSPSTCPRPLLEAVVARHVPWTGRTPCSSRAGSGPGGRGSSTSSSTTSSSPPRPRERIRAGRSRGPVPAGAAPPEVEEIEPRRLRDGAVVSPSPGRSVHLRGRRRPGVLTCHLQRLAVRPRDRNVAMAEDVTMGCARPLAGRLYNSLSTLSTRPGVGRRADANCQGWAPPRRHTGTSPTSDCRRTSHGVAQEALGRTDRRRAPARVGRSDEVTRAAIGGDGQVLRRVAEADR